MNPTHATQVKILPRLLQTFLVAAWVAFCWGFGGAAWGQIILPSKASVYEPIPVSIKAEIPPGSRVRGPGWILPPDLNVYRVSDTLLVVAAKPGEYPIRYQIRWIQLEEITFVDGTGKTIKILSYLGDGEYDVSATLTITGGTEPDPPGPDPQGPFQIMLFYDGSRLDNLPPKQREILTSLALRQKLVSMGHVVLEILEDDSCAGSVPEKYKPWIDKVKGDPMPRVALAPKDGGTITDYDLPANEAELLKLLEATP